MNTDNKNPGIRQTAQAAQTVQADNIPEKVTPMLEQYRRLREEYPGYVLFYRLGDFYEMFYDDAVLISRELELTLTARAGVPMCGVPHHASGQYLRRLIDKGYKIAVCEQIPDPDGKGLMKRAVVRLVTPGTITEDGLLDEGSNNFLACFFVGASACGMAFADLSTGELHALQKSFVSGEGAYADNIQKVLCAELSRYMPAEMLFNDRFVDYKTVSAFVKDKLSRCVGEMLDQRHFDTADISDIQALPCGDLTPANTGGEQALRAVCALLRYVNETQRSAATRFTSIILHQDDEYMKLSPSVKRNLELVEPIRARERGERKGTLLWVLDRTVTGMGKRKLRQMIERPLANPLDIMARLNAVEELTRHYVLLGELRSALTGIYDLERLMARVIYKTATPRDMLSLGGTLERLPMLKSALSGLTAPLWTSITQGIADMSALSALIANAIAADAGSANSNKDTGYIADGFNKELDRLRSLSGGSKGRLAELETKERQKTGIKTLKVGYNRVFGYYIEVSKGAVSAVPDRYVRKQTLTNGERYITEELKLIESEILTAGERMSALEAAIFAEVRDYAAAHLTAVQQAAQSVAYADALISFAAAACENDYVKPVITLEDVIDIRDGRHPVVEKMLDLPFTPNDTYIDLKDSRMLIITGPNMAGKSTYMRQTALIVLMAQLGSFVPAQAARIGVVDQIFTRIGAADDLALGQSTFMVEMNEVAEILSDATKKSLVILDEVGRGTSTFDGISIAKAVAEYINGRAIGCRTLFATHYHELTALAQNNKGIRNYSVTAVKKGEDLEFLHKIIPGGADDSFGIEVAKLAGLPKKVIDNAKQTLAALTAKEQAEKNRRNGHSAGENEHRQTDFFALAKERVIAKLIGIDDAHLTPEDALLVLREIKKELM
jgi:DNA mismatch repair protein MutS